MKIQKVQNYLLQNGHCNSRTMTPPQVNSTISELPNGIDGKFFVNVNFKGVSELMTAVEEDNVFRLQYELDRGTGINDRDFYGFTALIRAVVYNSQKCLDELLSNSELDVNAKDEDGNTALMKASTRSLYMVKKLLKHPDINVNITDKSGSTALHAAVRMSNQSIVEELLKHPNIDVNLQDNDRHTALMMATKCSSIKALLEHPDIDVNIQNEYGNTAIMGYLADGKYEFAKILLDRDDIDLTVKNAGGRTALDIVMRDFVGVDEKFQDALKLKTEYQLEHPGRIGKSMRIKKIPVDINKLSPEENIWTKEEISAKFSKLVWDENYKDALKMLNSTPLIDLNKELLDKICSTGNSDFARNVFNYERTQPERQTEYDRKRKEFLENTIKNLSYEELKTNNVALNTIDGFTVLIEHPEFNPNDKAENSSLFEKACMIDSEGNLAKEILSKYGDVYTADAAKTRNKVIKELIEDYENGGKYKFVLRQIEENAYYEDKRSIAAVQLNDLLKSADFKPDIVDEFGNTVLHIAASLPDDMGRTLIQLALDKGIDINSGNCVNQKPLMSAIKKLVITKDPEGKMNLMANIKFLLDKGADINAQDNNGQTAFHFACIGTMGALLTLLLSKNPNVFLTDKAGNRAAKYLKTPEMKEIYKKYIIG